nr:hypothetical protein [Streptomyces hygroscopicus]
MSGHGPDRTPVTVPSGSGLHRWSAPLVGVRAESPGSPAGTAVPELWPDRVAVAPSDPASPARVFGAR